MNRLKIIIIQKSENGYMFSIKDIGKPYSEAAPVNKVTINGPADNAGLRSGDGVVAINNNLVKGKTYIELCNIIKKCGDPSLEMTIIENYVSNLQRNKSENEIQNSCNTSTLLSGEESSQKSSSNVTKKKANTYDKKTLENFSELCPPDHKSYKSATELGSEIIDIDISTNDIDNEISGKYSVLKPNTNYKKANRVLSKTVTKSDSDISSMGKVFPNSTNSSIISSKIIQYDTSKIIYHQTYQNIFDKKSTNIKSLTVGQHNESEHQNLRGSTPVIFDSKENKCNPKISSSELSRKNYKKSYLSKSSNQTSSPMLQLNRVGGFARPIFSVDETFNLDEEYIEDFDSILNSETTAISTESDRSSCDLDTVDSSSRKKFRHIHYLPMPYKSHNISSNSLFLDTSSATEISRTPPQKSDSTKFIEKPLYYPLAMSTPCPGLRFVADNQESSYQDSLVDDDPHNVERLKSAENLFIHQNSNPLKNSKKVFDDNYGRRSKTLDSDGKLKNDMYVKVPPTSVFVKWISYEGKSHKSSWKQYIINIDDDRLIFCREKSKNHMKFSSLEDVTMSISLLNVTIEEEPERKIRRNTLRLFQAGKQTECLIDFLEKSVEVNWFHIICEKNKFDKDDKDSRTSSLRELQSFTSQNLFGKDNSQTQITKSKAKMKEDTIIPSQVAMVNASHLSSTQSNKSVINQVKSHVKNLKLKFASSGSESNFERQQEEWFNKTGSCSTNNKLVPSFSFNEEYQGAFDTVSSSGQLIPMELNRQVSWSETNNSNMLPLHKWRRSTFSQFVPLVVELCISIIETFGMDLVGLYRVSGKKLALDFISAELHKPISEIDVTTDKWNDLNAISGVLKSFFRNLPDGLFPKDMYSDIIGACRRHEFDRDQRLLSIQRYLSIMDIAQDHPEYRYHRETLRYLAEHLSRVASRHSINRMNAENLALIFANNLIKPPQETNQLLFNDYKYKIKLIETLIKYHKWLFSPTFESDCQIPYGSDDDLPLEDQQGAPFESTESLPPEMIDSRPLVKNIIAKARKMANEPLINLENSSNNDSSQTLAELSRQVYDMSCAEEGFKEVNIDEECERRKGKVESSALDKLKAETQNMLTECSKDLDELNGIQTKCQKDLSLMHYKIKKVNEEILLTETFFENTKEETHISKTGKSQLLEIPCKNLSSFSVALASPVFTSQIPTSEPHKAHLNSTEV